MSDKKKRTRTRMGVSLKRPIYDAFKKEVHLRGEKSIDGTAEQLVKEELDRLERMAAMQARSHLIAKAHSNVLNKELRRCSKKN